MREQRNAVRLNIIHVYSDIEAFGLQIILCGTEFLGLIADEAIYKHESNPHVNICFSFFFLFEAY